MVSSGAGDTFWHVPSSLFVPIFLSAAFQICDLSYVFLFHALIRIEQVLSSVVIAFGVAELAPCIFRRSTAIAMIASAPPAWCLTWRARLPPPPEDWVPRSCGRFVADLLVVRVLREAIGVAGLEAMSSDCGPAGWTVLMAPASEEEFCLLIVLWAVLW